MFLNDEIYEQEYTYGDYYIPRRMMPGIKRYIENGILPGDFLQAVICNDLKNAVGKADDENIRNLPAYVCFFYNHAPAGCWTSKEIMLNWSKERKREQGNK